MMNIFAYIWKKDAPPVFNGRPFLIKEVGEELQTQFADFSSKQCAAEKKYSLPLPLRILSAVCMVAGAIIVCGILSALTKTPIAEAYANAPALFYVGPLCLAVWLTLFLINFRLRRKINNSEEYIALEADAETLLRKSSTELAVPADAPKIDIISCFHKEKNGVVMPIASANMLDERSVYLQNDTVCFADISSVVSVPLSSVRNVRYVKKRTICVGGWNKEEKINAPRYKKYVYMSNTNIVLKGHYVIEVADVRGEYEILVPAYDFNVLCEATGYRVAYAEELK